MEKENSLKQLHRNVEEQYTTTQATIGLHFFEIVAKD